MSWYALDNIEYSASTPMFRRIRTLIADSQQNDCHSSSMQRISKICNTREHCDNKYGGYDTERCSHI